MALVAGIPDPVEFHFDLLEAGTIIRGVKPPDSVLLLPATSSGTR